VPDRLDAEPDQVPGTGQFDHREHQVRALHQGPDAQGHTDRHHLDAGRIAGHRRQRRPPAVRQGTPNHEQHARARDGNHDQAGDGEAGHLLT